MKTRLTTSAKVAARLLREGGTVAFPTETVYGLGALAFDAKAVRRIFIAKGRPDDNPLIVHIADRSQVSDLAQKIPAYARQLMDAFWPGPLTLVLPRSSRVPDVVTAGLDTVGVRLPSHSIAHEFLREVGAPVAAPSANRSGRPSPTSWQAVVQDLNGRVAAILKGSRSGVGLESTVVDCTGRAPVILRAGGMTLEQLREVVPQARSSSEADRRRGRSPGLKHRHYAPRAEVVLTDTLPVPAPAHSAWIGIGASPKGVSFRRSCKDIREYAHEVFHFFRACEAKGIKKIYCQSIPLHGMGVALMDRLRRAAAGTAKLRG